jgi:hypothetical protein
VPQAFAERLAAYQDIRPAGYKFLGKFPGNPPTYRDYVEARPDLKSVEAKARAHLHGAESFTMITLSKADLANMNLKESEVRK